MSYEEWEANQQEAPEPGECYCHLLHGQKLCQVCTDDLVLVKAEEEEVYGLPTPQPIELGPLEVAFLISLFEKEDKGVTIQ